MAKQERPYPRPITDADTKEIQEIWRKIHALRAMRRHALPPTTQGAWIYERATEEIRLLTARLDKIVAETHPELDL